MSSISFSDYYTNMDLKEVYGVYGNPHRMFIQAMLTRGIIDSCEIKELFQVIMNRCGVKVPEAKETRLAYKEFYSAINSKIREKCGLRLVKCLDEEVLSKRSFMALVNITDRSKDSNKLTIKDQVNFLPHEMEYLKLLVDNIMEDQLHELRETKALSLRNKVVKSDQKIQTLDEAQIILQKFQDCKWLTTCKETGAILLSTRFIIEMEPFLRENYPDLSMCSSCQKIVIRPIECETDRCSGVFHYHCSYKRNKEGKSDKVDCTICRSKLPDRKEVYANFRKKSSSNRTRPGQERKRMESD